jgi:hypothetical protein
MRSLEGYTKYFDEVYLKYGDARYGHVLRLVKAYDVADVKDYVKGPDFGKAARVIEPLTAIKNYKSQVPYPSDTTGTITCIIELRKTNVTRKDVLSRHYDTLTRLLGIGAFQLPTVSAILHFCHPRYFPIVDINVTRACALLKRRHPSDFKGLVPPQLPAHSELASNKIEKYRYFIRFIDRIIELQKRIEGQHDYRRIDKALMVLGASRRRERAERLFNI